jgi:hypothetical protein
MISCSRAWLGSCLYSGVGSNCLDSIFLYSVFLRSAPTVFFFLQFSAVRGLVVGLHSPSAARPWSPRRDLPTTRASLTARPVLVSPRGAVRCLIGFCTSDPVRCLGFPVAAVYAPPGTRFLSIFPCRFSLRSAAE